MCCLVGRRREFKFVCSFDAAIHYIQAAEVGVELAAFNVAWLMETSPVMLLRSVYSLFVVYISYCCYRICSQVLHRILLIDIMGNRLFSTTRRLLFESEIVTGLENGLTRTSNMLFCITLEQLI